MNDNLQIVKRTCGGKLIFYNDLTEAEKRHIIRR